MVVQGMLLENKEWHSPLTANLPSPYVSKINSLKVLTSSPFPQCYRIDGSVGHAPGAFRTIELDVDIGSAGFDYYALQKSEVPLPPQQLSVVVRLLIRDVEFKTY